MNAAFSKNFPGRLLLAVLAGLLLTGCATPRIDWVARIGHYTFDQAVLELGPPDKRAELQDGTVVAEWLTRRGYTYAHATPGYGYPYWYGPGGTVFTDTTPDYYLRLTFGPDGKLASWRKFAK